MKPTKNRYFCPDCREYKMGFETEKKAYSFIEHESENILEENGYCPIRAYKCPVCGCWHLTSELLLEDCFDSECCVDKEEMEISRKLLGLVVRNTHTIALHLRQKISKLNNMLKGKTVDWETVRSLTEELIEIFENVCRTPYRYVYNVRKQWNEFLELCHLYAWRKNQAATA